MCPLAATEIPPNASPPRQTLTYKSLTAQGGQVNMQASIISSDRFEDSELAEPLHRLRANRIYATTPFAAPTWYRGPS